MQEPPVDLREGRTYVFLLRPTRRNAVLNDIHAPKQCLALQNLVAQCVGDMTDAMLELAERNRAEAGVENVRFLEGIIEAIPLPAESVDVVISNCVINLSADKGKVLREAYRVLTPGGRFAVSDIVFQRHFPRALRADLQSWAGCIAGALEEETYRELLASAGFTEIEVEVTRRYPLQGIAESGASASLSTLSEAERSQVDGRFVSALLP